jgi:xanthine/uracil permease
LVALGVVPKVAALFATIPPAVIGGGGLLMFSMIFASGLAIVHRSVPMNRRAMVILAVAIGLGLGVELRPDVLQHLPESVRMFFGTGLVTGGLAALVLNLVFPEEDGETVGSAE